MRAVVLAIETHKRMNGAFPSAKRIPDDARHSHSGRLALTQYLYRVGYLDAYDFDKPWNSPGNIDLGCNPLMGKGAEVRVWGPPTVYHSPRSSGRTPAEDTNFLLITGEQTVFRAHKPVSDNDVVDGLGTTLIAIEVLNTGIHWLEPRDFHHPEDLDLDNPDSLLSKIRLGKYRPHVAFADGGIYLLDPRTDVDILDAMCTISGGEPLNREQLVADGLLTRVIMNFVGQ